MTAEQILKLDNIKRPEDLKWRKESWDAGHPECKCSACGEQVKDDEEFDYEEDYEAEQAARNNFPIRLWSGEGKNMVEAVVHTECFMWLHERGILQQA